MANERDYQGLYDRIAALRDTLAQRMAGELIEKPQLAELLTKHVDELLAAAVAAEQAVPPPADGGLAQLSGVGPEAASKIGDTRIPFGVPPYDEAVSSERIVAVGDLYYIYQHERIGVFRVVHKLRELFRAGTVRLSNGSGAFGLYQFDRREVLRYTRRDRSMAYRRVLGYGAGPVPTGSRANTDVHGLFTHFVNQVTLYWRDKRISDVLRERAQDPAFGSIAMVRRAGLDLRNNLKFMSFGHLNVLRVELMQLLDEAFKILESDDIKRLFGADTAWDVIEDVLIQHFNERLVTSPRQRMAIAGRDILRWLAASHLLQSTQSQFEALLNQVAVPAEEWLTSAQSMGLAERRRSGRVLPWERPRSPSERPARVFGGRNGSAERELELEL